MNLSHLLDERGAIRTKANPAYYKALFDVNYLVRSATIMMAG